MCKGEVTAPIKQEVFDELWNYDSVKRISQLPVVETSYQYVANIYTSLKAQSRLVSWGLAPAEVTLKIAVSTTLPTVKFLPLSFVDAIICRGLDTVERTIPAIKYSPHQMMSEGKEYVSSKVIQPVLKRADSVKQLGLSEATRVGEIAATRLDTALDIADNLVEKYLPDSSDALDGSKKKDEGESKTSHAINHMNRFGKKLQRRLTKRTLMEARALKQGGSDIVQALLYLGDLLIHDPRAFANQMASAWAKLSEDEPENQVPPANLEQVLALLARETSRKFVHTLNFVVAKLPAQSARAVRFTIHHAEVYVDYALKIVHLEGAKNAGIAIVSQRLEQLRSLVLQILEILTSGYKGIVGKQEYPIPMVPIAASPAADPNANTSLAPAQPLDPKPESKPVETKEVPRPSTTVSEAKPEEDKDQLINGSPKNATSDAPDTPPTAVNSYHPPSRFNP